MSLIHQCLTPWAVIINQMITHSCTELYASSLPADPFVFIDYYPVYLKTLFLELPIYYFFLRKDKSFLKIFGIGVLVNTATHPIVYIYMPQLFSKFNLNYLQYLIIAEIFAPTVEMLLLKYLFKTKWSTSVFASLLANLFSWTVGVYWM